MSCRKRLYNITVWLKFWPAELAVESRALQRSWRDGRSLSATAELALAAERRRDIGVTAELAREKHAAAEYTVRIVQFIRSTPSI